MTRSEALDSAVPCRDGLRVAYGWQGVRRFVSVRAPGGEEFTRPLEEGVVAWLVPTPVDPPGVETWTTTPDEWALELLRSITEAKASAGGISVCIAPETAALCVLTEHEERCVNAYVARYSLPADCRELLAAAVLYGRGWDHPDGFSIFSAEQLDHVNERLGFAAGDFFHTLTQRDYTRPERP